MLSAAALLGTLQPDASDPQSPAPGPTTLEVSRDVIDDSIRAFVVYRSGGGRLSVGCDRDRFDGVRVMLSDRGWFAPRLFLRRRPVSFRFDATRPQRQLWRADEGAAYLAGRRVRHFLRRMAVAERFAIRATDVEDRPREYVFSPAAATSSSRCWAPAPPGG